MTIDEYCDEIDASLTMYDLPKCDRTDGAILGAHKHGLTASEISILLRSEARLKLNRCNGPMDQTMCMLGSQHLDHSRMLWKRDLEAATAAGKE